MHAALPPPVSVCGLQAIPVNERFPFCAGSSVNACKAPPSAVTEAEVLVVTAAAFTVNVAAVIPGPIVTDCGDVRLALEEPSAKVVLASAGLANARVHVLAPGV